LVLVQLSLSLFPVLRLDFQALGAAASTAGEFWSWAKVFQVQLLALQGNFGPGPKSSGPGPNSSGVAAITAGEFWAQDKKFQVQLLALQVNSGVFSTLDIFRCILKGNNRACYNWL